MKANERRGPRAGLRGAPTFSKVADEQSALKSMEKPGGQEKSQKKCGIRKAQIMFQEEKHGHLCLVLLKGSRNVKEKM